MFGIIKYSEEEIDTVSKFLMEHQEEYTSMIRPILSYELLVRISLALILSFSLDKAIRMAILGNSLVLFGVLVFVVYTIATVILSGNYAHFVLVLKYEGNRFTKFKMFANVIINSVVDSMVMTLVLLIFVVVLRKNLTNVASVLYVKYGTDISELYGIFENLPFIFLHFAMLYVI